MSAAVCGNLVRAPFFDSGLLGKSIIHLIQEPTSVYQLQKLGRSWDHSQLFIKREDLTATTYGGNKVRNLEYILGDVVRSNAKGITTAAPYGSNFIAALAAHAKNLGLPVHIHHFVPHCNEQIRLHGEFSAKQGVQMHFYETPSLIPVTASSAFLSAMYQHLSDKFYFIAPGGSNVLGAMGHVSAAFECAQQIKRGEIPKPDVLVVGAGTCGTMAGLLAGFKLANIKVRIIGVRCVDRIVCNRKNIARLANAALREFQSSAVILPNEIELRGPSPEEVRYAHVQKGVLEIIQELESEEHLTLDTTYTSKVMTFLKRLVQSGEVRKQNLLYWHTFSPLALLQ